MFSSPSLYIARVTELYMQWNNIAGVSAPNNYLYGGSLKVVPLSRAMPSPMYAWILTQYGVFLQMDKLKDGVTVRELIRVAGSHCVRDLFADPVSLECLHHSKLCYIEGLQA
jgi:hypothetical protein